MLPPLPRSPAHEKTSRAVIQGPPSAPAREVQP